MSRHANRGSDIMAASIAEERRARAAVMKSLTEAQERALRLMAEGRDPRHGISGRSAHGGLMTTIISLRKRGLIDGLTATDAAKDLLRKIDVYRAMDREVEPIE